MQAPDDADVRRVIDRLLGGRAAALQRGDRHLVAEINIKLRSLGHQDPAPEVERADMALPEAAVPPKPRRGRPPKAALA